ncbi:Nn.00g105400.m01.CDS01 [Neocucurbitaria sp. VM-36]
MPTEEPGAKWPGRNPKSCAECRRRKVRCNWPSETAQTCSYCESRGLFCEPQRLRTPAPEAVRVTTRARLVNLERNQSSIWAAIRDLQAHSGMATCDRWLPSHDEQSQRQSSASHFNGVDDVDDDTDASEDLIPPNAPTHLLQLFDNSLLDSDGHGLAHGIAAPSNHPTSPQKVQACAALRALTPSRADMATISAYATSWLPLYASLFPMVNGNTTPESMLALHNELQHHDDPVALATLLLYIAMTVQHAPATASFPTSESMQNLSIFVKNVADTVEHIVIADDNLAGTIEGIEAGLLFLRLQLGRVKVTKMWVQSRRVIALAELLGLPRAATALASLESMELTSPASHISRLKQRAQAWESLCAIDRVTSMLCSLPLATGNYPLPKRPLIDSLGKVNAQAYIYSLAGIASRVLELDGMKSARKPLSELFNAVMRTDHELGSLASFPGKDWWNMKPSTDFSIDIVLQYWHKYFIVRTHLQLALTYDGQNEQFAFNFITCLNACQEVAGRYLSLRPAIPTGFFANWVIDMQAFTSAVFLQLASYRITHISGAGRFSHGFDVKIVADLIDQVVKTMESSTGRTGGDFAQQAASVIRSLDSLFQRPHVPESQRISLSLPLIGTIQISRRSYSKANFSTGQSVSPLTMTHTQPQISGNETSFLNSSAAFASQPNAYTSDTMDLMDSFTYSMEFPESYPFLADDNFSGWMQ